MGQKANITSVRKTQASLNINTFNSKALVNIFYFLNVFECLLKKKDVLLLDKTINFLNNKCYLNLQLFYKISKLTRYKRKKKRNKVIQSFLNVKNTKLSLLFLSLLNMYRSNFMVLSIKNVNKSVNYKLVAIFFIKTKSYIKTIFSRRFNLYVDFLKLNALFYQNKISLYNYIKLISVVFTMLSKRTHGRFLVLIRLLLKLLSSNLFLKKKKFDRILGIKFKISGKLKGKLRSSSSTLQEGFLSTQSFSQNISFSQTSTLTLIGVFGLKIWTYRK